MKSLIKKIGVSLVLLAFSSGVHAQPPMLVDFGVNVSLPTTIYGNYNVPTYLTIDFNSNAGTKKIAPGGILIQIGLTNGCELAATGAYTPPAGWSYNRISLKNGELTNTDSIMTLTMPGGFGSNATQTFDVPFTPTTLITAQDLVVTVISPLTSPYPYNDFDNTNDFSSVQITVLNNAPLGVQFSSFLAVNKGCTNDISWSTLSEKGNDYFNVERSSNGKEFTSIAQIPSKGNRSLMQNYSFVDANPIKGANYYRIRQTSLNKESTLTTVKEVETNCTMADISIYPNPTYNVVYVKGLSVGETVELYNAIGQLVQKTDVKSETEVINISKFTDGVYHIRVLRNNESIYTTKVVKR